MALRIATPGGGDYTGTLLVMKVAGLKMRAMMLVACLLATGPALAQTPEVPLAPAHAKPAKRAATVRAPANKVAVNKKHGVPVVAPRHGTLPRQLGHRNAKLVEPVAPPKPAPPKPAAPVKPAIPADQGTVTGLHLPRYASLKTDDVNMRSGPGSRYPVLWTYKRRELPVRIEREFDIWRLVEDMDGTRGWVHQATLTGRRTFVITGTQARELRSEASDASAAAAILKPGVVGRIRACDAGAAWCQVQVGEYRGWLARADFWGSDAGEAVAP